MLRLRGVLPLILLLIPRFPATAASTPLLILEPGFERASLEGGLELWQDLSGQADLDQVRAQLPAFRHFDNPRPNLGYTDGVWWAYFSIDSSDYDQESFILQLSYPPTEQVSVYTIAGYGRVESQESGAIVPPGRRLSLGRTYGFPVETSEDVTEVFARIATSSVVRFDISIWEMRNFRRFVNRDTFFIGLYFGIVVAMLIYNTFFFVTSKDRIFLLYAAFILFLCLFHAAILGVGVHVLWPNHPGISNRMLVIGASLALFFATVLTRDFLKLGERNTALRSGITIAMVITALNAVQSVFVAYRTASTLNSVLLVLLPIAYLGIGVTVYLQGYRPARFWLIGWSVMIIGVLVTTLVNFGLVPTNNFTDTVLIYGSGIQMVFLALAVTERINVLQAGIASAKAAEIDAVEQRLYSDNLTGLPNRNRLIADLAKTDNARLLLVNLDGFRQINDYYGIRTGDDVIRQLKGRIVEFGDAIEATVYRLHADEFAVVADRPVENDAIRELGQDLLNRVRNHPYSVQGRPIRLEFSVGISEKGANYLEQADMAMAEARREGVKLRVYDDKMDTHREYERNIHLTGLLKDVIDGGRVRPHFQPILHNGSGEIRKHECLMRLTDKRGEFYPLAEMLPVAKASRLYPELSRLMMDRCFDAIAVHPGDFSLNISVEDVKQHDTLSLIRRRVDDSNASRLIFEILESEGFESYDIVVDFIAEMRERGCRIAIDDFGTGYSNFAHIMKMEVDILKIDHSLIKEIHQDPQAKAVVHTIAAFAKGLGLETVAEYVHSEEVLRTVTEIGIDYSQGYLVGRPEAEPKGS